MFPAHLHQQSSQMTPYASGRDHSSSSLPALVSIRNIVRRYEPPEGVPITALNGVSLEIYKGEFLAVTGHSGSGKSTFLNLIGLIDEPSSGDIIINGRNTSLFSEKERTEFRLNALSFVFQSFNLIENFTALENIAFQLRLQGYSKRDAHKQAQETLNYLGLQDRARLYPRELSGGEQQRIAIGRALVKDSFLLLADEPTAHLDSKNSQNVMELLSQVNREFGRTIVLVTHETEETAFANHTVTFRDGRITSDERAETENSAIIRKTSYV